MWRDNDEVGYTAQIELCGILQSYGCTVYVLPDIVLAAKPLKWDAADALVEGMDASGLQALLARFTPAPQV
jgi:hypothetical protein